MGQLPVVRSAALHVKKLYRVKKLLDGDATLRLPAGLFRHGQPEFLGNFHLHHARVMDGYLYLSKVHFPGGFKNQGCDLVPFVSFNCIV
jgi:hypothetical protein